MAQPSPDFNPAPTKTAAPSGAGIIIALVPWFLFTIIAEHGTLKIASIAAVVIAVAVCFYSARDGGRPKMIEIAAVVTFIGFTIVAFIADPSVTHWLTRYARAVAAGVLALLVFGSLLFVPFTEEYARQMVPREHWNSPRFKRINRRAHGALGRGVRGDDGLPCHRRRHRPRGHQHHLQLGDPDRTRRVGQQAVDRREGRPSGARGRLSDATDQPERPARGRSRALDLGGEPQ